jgi:hypothetical protein
MKHHTVSDPESAYAAYAEFIHCSERQDQLKSAPKDAWFWLDSPTALQTQWHWLVDLSDMPWFKVLRASGSGCTWTKWTNLSEYRSVGKN